MTYHHLSQEERHQISVLLKAKLTQAQISANFGRHKSTISREISHNVVALVGNKLFDTGNQTDAFLPHHTIGGVARREDKCPGSTMLVDHCVDFAVAPVLGKPDRLKISPHFTPLAQRWILHDCYRVRPILAARRVRQCIRRSFARLLFRSNGHHRILLSEVSLVRRASVKARMWTPLVVKGQIATE